MARVVSMMSYYIKYSFYYVYNLFLEMVTLNVLMYSVSCVNVLIWPTEFFDMRAGDSLIARFVYFPIVQGSVWFAAIALLSILIYNVNRVYLSRVASVTDPSKIALLTTVVFVVFNYVWITTFVFIFKYSGH